MEPIADVERVQDVFICRLEGQLLFVGPFDQATVQHADYSHATSPEARHKIAIHRVFVDVDLDPAH
jgi:hypothetical protein